MKIQIIRECKNCFFHYYSDLEDDICFQEGGCLNFSPIGLMLKDVEVVSELGYKVDYCNNSESDV